jgi:hypothetical protein
MASGPDHSKKVIVCIGIRLLRDLLACMNEPSNSTRTRATTRHAMTSAAFDEKALAERVCDCDCDCDCDCTFLSYPVLIYTVHVTIAMHC